MKRNELFRILTESGYGGSKQRRPAGFNNLHEYDLLDDGHVVEYYEVGPEKVKVLAMLFEKGDMLFKSHPCSHFENIDNAIIVHMKRDRGMEIINQFPNAAALFSIFLYRCRKKYLMKLAQRIRIYKEDDPSMRYMHLLTSQPWVFDQLPPIDIASYLGVPVDFVIEQLRVLQFFHVKN